MRDLFHVPSHYFLSHSVGCLPKATEAGMANEFFGPWKSGANWAEWMPVLDQFRAGLGALLSVDSASVCPQTNISSALTKVLYSLPEDKTRKTILLSKQDFPTIGFVFEQAKRCGLDVRFIEGDPCDASNWERAMDASTAIVHVTHALSNTSHLLPVREICALARANGAVSIVDIAQSFGAVPIDLKGWNADFAIGTGVKFLCAGPGACFLYVSPNILPKCAPLDVGWFSHENPFEMDIMNFRYASDAMRFFGGTPSPAPYVTANSAIKLWQSLGLNTVRDAIQAKLSHLCGAAPVGIIVSPMDAASRGATLVVSPTNRAAARQGLTAGGIKCDERKEGFRFSVHGYTPQEDVETLSAILAALT